MKASKLGTDFMDYLHCPGCGQKALTVATRCPRCGMPFETRYAEHPAGGSSRRRMPVWALFGAAVLIVLAVNAIGQKLHRMSKASPVEASAALDLPPTPRAAVAAAESAPPAPAADPVGTESLSSAQPAPAGDAPAEAATPRTLALSPPPPPAQPVSPANEVERDGTAAERRFAQTWVNVRSGRSGNAPVVRILKPGEPVKVDLLEAGWYRVVAERQQGYVDGRYLDTSPPAALP